MESPRLACLGFDWTLQAQDPTLVRFVTSLYDACVAPGAADHRFVLQPGTSEPSRLTLARDGHAVLRDAPLGLAIAYLAWEVNRGVVEETRNRLLLHAAAAERQGSVVLLAGPSETGKSTLVAALVRAGLRYVTDETVAVDPATTTIDTYPKPIALDPGSRALFPDFPPDAEPAFRAVEQWLVPPRMIRADAVAPPGGITSLILLPVYRPDRPTAARQLTRAQAVVALAEHSFNFQTFGHGALDVIARVVRGSRCYQLDVGDLDAACRVSLDLLEPAAVEL